jgi:hypothetical protein
MPLTALQSKIGKVIAKNRSPESHLAGGAALHAKPNSIRYSLDLDYFHDSEVHVAEAFSADQKTLNENGYKVELEIRQPGYIRAMISLAKDSTKLEWAQDSTWRFMPVQKDPDLGYVLHPMDLAVNKLLALVGRDEPRDFLDVHYIHQNILPLGALCWAACGKDPGFGPESLFEILRRRGKYHGEDFARLNLKKKVDIHKLKEDWLQMLTQAQGFLQRAPTEDLGCLYFDTKKKDFVEPTDFMSKQIRPHFGRPGGVIPKFV